MSDAGTSLPTRASSSHHPFRQASLYEANVGNLIDRDPGTMPAAEGPSISVKAANDNLNDELIGRTREVWRPRLGRDLSRDESKQIASNVTGFFAILAELSRPEMPDPTEDNSDASTSDDVRARDDR